MNAVQSRPCTRREMESLRDLGFHDSLKETWTYHRKLWEYLVVVRGFEETTRRVGARAIGFGVGREPLVAYLASMGAEVVATDGETTDTAALWLDTGQHSGGSLAAFNDRQIARPADFAMQVRFCSVDMRAIPEDLKRGQFDFSWSCCAFEHLGSLDAGFNFFLDQMACLKPGGWAFHTTEFNVSSNEDTLATGDVVAYRHRDVDDLIVQLRDAGHRVAEPAWALVEEVDPPNADSASEHLTFELAGYSLTSFLIAAQRGQ